ncbi:aldehyde dehydrogenase family protein [Burkholderia sp. L27(2015)]|uniref:aldehyde dehydrogenase family protein n=1 Tax=Burkholderia sp. L27(2015) TaxID=1641858 RepID=UPI00131A7F6D|nr:aldehyde dehydrogenase family protein [Burkholderia sp. L27(2015)]
MNDFIEEISRRTIFIGGRWQESTDGQVLSVEDPGSGVCFAKISNGNARDVDDAVRSSRIAFESEWQHVSAYERGRVLRRISDEILSNLDILSNLEARDTGKPIRNAVADITICARYFEYYGGGADKLHGDTIPSQNGYFAATSWEPWGVTAHIIPWNYPAQIFARCVAPALAAGNTCVVKPAEDACLSILWLAELATRAGLPPGVLNIVTGEGKHTGAALVENPEIDFLSFTGSVDTGVQIQRMAANRNLPVTLELGGKSPQLVFADADLSTALSAIFGSITQHAGQTCSAGSRLLVDQAIFPEVKRRLGELFSSSVANYSSSNATCGPLMNGRQLANVSRAVALAQEEGAYIVAQGSIAHDASRTGYYYPPTLLGGVAANSGAFLEEIFGPVLTMTTFDTEDEAVALANATKYGLAAGVWTKDGATQLRVARQLKCGQVYVNNYGTAGGVELPFGGVKRSGFGREKGFEALRTFSVLKTISFRYSSEGAI